MKPAESLWAEIGAHISRAAGQPFAPRERQAVGGGCINRAYAVSDGARRYFVKLNEAAKAAMFEAEAAGLEEIAASGAIRCPRPLCRGTAENSAYLVLEYIDLGDGPAAAHEALGRQLAQMHRTTGERHGWRIDNTIGATPQINTPDPDWIAFWCERRLSVQLELAARNGYGGALQRKGERLAEKLPALFAGHAPVPSLLHGDLWGGNWGVDSQGRPVIFDPAVYYGDRETDIAMTELFGGFSARFYAAYRDAFPLTAGYAVRKNLYNLYHVLNHLNLFGGGYRAQAEGLMDKLLAEIG
jgi:fructosamine-3-kinase